MQLLKNIIFSPLNSQPLRLKVVAGIFILSACFLLSWSMFSSSLQSQWSLVDDHEIAYFLGPDQKISLFEAWDVYIHETEISKYGIYERFRPGYYAFRMLESVLWNDELVFWYLSNILIFSIFIATFCYLSSELIGLGLAGLISFCMATSLYWVDVFARLGPSEPYAILGMSMLAFGIYFIYVHPKIHVGWPLLCLGVMFCVGSKENFFPLLLPVVWVAWDQWRKGSLSIVRWLWLMMVAVWSIWIASAILVSISRSGQDVYQTPVSDKLGILLAGFNRTEVVFLIIVLLVFSVIWFFARRQDSQLQTAAHGMALASGFCLILYLVQILIYGGDFPNGDRYDVPGLLIWPVLAVLVIWFLKNLPTPDNFSRTRQIFLLSALIIATSIAVTRWDHIATIQAKSIKHVRDTRKFTKDFENLARIANSAPQHGIVFQVDDAIGSYEAVFGYNQFLRYYKVINRNAILYVGESISPNDPIYPYFHDLTAISAGGMGALPDFSLGGDFVPLEAIRAGGQDCILVLFSVSPPALDCAVVFEVVR